MPDTEYTLQPKTRSDKKQREAKEFIQKILDDLGAAAKHREQLASTVYGGDGPNQETSRNSKIPDTVWTCGKYMWEPGSRHLPSEWTNTICPEHLKLKTVPTLNVYRALVEQIQGGILGSMPTLTFEVSTEEEPEPEVPVAPEMPGMPGMAGMAGMLGMHEMPGMAGMPGMGQPPMEGEMPGMEPPMGGVSPGMFPEAGGQMPGMPGLPEGEMEPEEQAPDVGQILTDAWKQISERSRLMSELELEIEHNCNFGSGWLGIHENDNGDPTLRAVYPELVIGDQFADRPEEMQWVAKMFSEKWRGEGPKPDELQRVDELRWPDNIIKPESGMLRIEIWIRKGTTFAGRDFKDHGMHVEIRSDGKIVTEEEWDDDDLPLIPVYLMPSNKIVGYSLAVLLWQQQVAVDKIYAVLMSKMNRAATDYIRLPSDAEKVGEPGEKLSDAESEQQNNLGVTVISSNSSMQVEGAPPIPKELVLLLDKAIAHMERLASISQPYQGIAPGEGVTAGVAIGKLVQESAKGISRKAQHLCEALRHLGKVWAKFELKRQGIEVPEGLEVKVSLQVLEEETRKTQYMGIKLAQETIPDIVKLPAFQKIVVQTIPGLTDDQRNELLEAIEARVEPMPGGPGVPEGMPGIEGAGPMPPGGMGQGAMGAMPEGPPMPPYPAPGVGEYGQVPMPPMPAEGPPQGEYGGY